MKLNSIQFCWWQSRWYFPTFFRLTLKTSRCPFYYSSKCSLLEICLGKCELESCSIKSRSEGFTAYIFQIWHIYSKWWWGAAGLFKTWKYGKSEFSDNIRTYQSITSAPRVQAYGGDPSLTPTTKSSVLNKQSHCSFLVTVNTLISPVDHELGLYPFHSIRLTL